jgi:hypothetical protein
MKTEYLRKNILLDIALKIAVALISRKQYNFHLIIREEILIGEKLSQTIWIRETNKVS